MDSQNGTIEIATPIILKSDGRQHDLKVWCDIIAKEILNIENLIEDRLKAAEEVRELISRYLQVQFHDAILKERLDLLNPNHCDRNLNPFWFASEAMMDIQMIKSEWQDYLKTPEWSDPALQVICTHLATALHIERLWFADENPDNKAAQNYKSKFKEIH